MHSFHVYAILSFALSSAATSPNTLPIYKRNKAGFSKRQNAAAIGLGNIQDVEYSIQAKIGSDSIPLILDTGSSDIWSVSTDCTSTSCGLVSDTPQISASDLKATGLDVEINYGDTTHPTSVSGMVFTGTVSLAGLEITDQNVAAINRSTTKLERQGISGIFGAGFPISSEIFRNIIRSRITSSTSTPAITDAYISLLPQQGSMMSRLITSGKLQQPMYTITLQRDTFDIGGNVGQLTIGQLPDGVSNSSLTWVPVRMYTEEQGGLAGPTSSPKEVYPSRWEIPIDDVTLNGQTLPKPPVNASTGYTALIDSGTSFLAAPKSLVPTIYSGVSGGATSSSSRFSSEPPTIPCDNPVHLTFMIGGKPFPLDPRDFMGQNGEVGDCTAGSLLPTDEPSEGSLMSWILGSPFMKSNLVAFYFGNLTHPSVDPPRIGFLSTVPSNVDDLYREALNEAKSDGEFDLTSVAAPTTTFAAASTNSAGVAQASTDDDASPTSGSGRSGGGSSGGSSDGGLRNGETRIRPSFALSLSAVVFGFLIC